MTMQNLLQQCRKKSHSKVLRFWVVLAAVALLLVLACRGYDWDALGRYKGDNISSLHYVRGRVVEVLRDDTKPDQLDPARSMGTQELRILLLEGANKGTEVTIANYLTRTQNVRLRPGDTAIFPPPPPPLSVRTCPTARMLTIPYTITTAPRYWC